MSANGAVTTNIAIQHPNIFYIGDSWSSNNSPEFWNQNNSATTINNNTVNKTIYSPSPTGYVEPKTAAFSGFTLNGNNGETANVYGEFSKGFYFYCQPKFQGTTMFFSALGDRHKDTNAINQVSSIGTYWAAGPSGTGIATYARGLYFNYNKTVNPQDDPGRFRAYGCTLQSVSE